MTGGCLQLTYAGRQVPALPWHSHFKKRCLMKTSLGHKRDKMPNLVFKRIYIFQRRRQILTMTRFLKSVLLKVKGKEEISSIIFKQRGMEPLTLISICPDSTQ